MLQLDSEVSEEEEWRVPSQLIQHFAQVLSEWCPVDAGRAHPAQHKLPKPRVTQLVPQAPHLVGMRMNQGQCDSPGDDGGRCLRLRGHYLLDMLGRA